VEWGSFAQCKNWIEASSVSNGQGEWSITTDIGTNVYSSGSFNLYWSF